MGDFPQINQCDPRAGVLRDRPEIEAAISAVLESGEYILGRSVRAFESAFARFIGVPYAVGVANGTDAIHLALRALGIVPGDEVITVSHTAVATVAAIEMAGATPVLVDIDPDTYTIDPARVEGAISPRTRAIVPVHLYGQPADLRALQAMAHRYGIAIVEDCAQAHGALYRGRRVGAYGAAGCFSFYPTKNLGGIGDGGMVVTGRAEVYERLLQLRQYGWKERFVSVSKGMNSRLDELQAAILLVRLAKLDEDTERRITIAEAYDRLLQSASVITPTVAQETRPVYHLYVIRHPQRDALRRWLQDHRIGTGVHYPVPIHLQQAYRSTRRGPLPVTERTADEVLSLPLYPDLSMSLVEHVAQQIKAFDSLQDQRSTRPARSSLPTRNAYPARKH